MLDVYSISPDLAGTLCRFCLKEETSLEPHYQLDWFKWPHSEVTRLYEQVIGEELPVSAHLSEHFCSGCQWWLKETNDRMQLFKNNCQFWVDYLDIHAKPVVKEEENVPTIVGVEEQIEMEPQSVEFEYVQYEEELEQKHYVESTGPIAVENHGPYTQDREATISIKPSAAVDSESVGEIEYLDVDLFSDGEFECDDNIDQRDESISNQHDPDDDAPNEEEKSKNFNGYEIPHRDGSIGWTYWNLRAPVIECEMCGKIFKRKHAMIRHFEQEHQLLDHFSCESCTTVFRTKESLEQHSRIHPLKTVFKCDLCDKLYDSEYYLRRHQRSVHGPVQTAQCTICYKVFFSTAKLYNHMQRHGEKKEHCDQCGRKFHMKKDLKSHIEIVHEQIRRFVCESCGHKFSCKALLQTHVGRGCAILPKRRPVETCKVVRPELQCTKCDMKCMRPETLRRHFERVHPEDDWDAVAERICTKCLRQFVCLELMAEHQEKHHPVWQCDICKAVLTTELSLERHKKIHTVKDRPFKCEECQGTYVTQHQLKMHFRRRHTNERPFACPSCDRRYADRSEMNVHIRSAHGNGERHHCTRCPKSFLSAKYLGLHVARDHTGQFNFFECSMCDGQYVNARVLAEHQAVHHPTTT